MNHKEAVQHVKTTLMAFGPGDAITLTQKTWANLHEAMRVLADQPAPVQQGWKLVPVVPTNEMIAALGFGGDVDMAIGHAAISKGIEDAYTAMLAAAAQPAQPVVDCHATGVCVQSGLRAEKLAQQSCYCPNCEALSKELSELKAQRLPRVHEEAQAFKTWFDDWWLGDNECGKSIPAQGHELFANYMSEYTLAFGAWMAAKGAAPQPAQDKPRFQAGEFSSPTAIGNSKKSTA